MALVDVLFRFLYPFSVRTIALDSGGLSGGKSTKLDKESAKRLLERSSWKGQDLKKVMKMLEDDLDAAKDALNDLTVRDLLRRDWKGDA